MQRHASILGVVWRRLTTLYSPASTQKSPLQPHLIHCVKIGSTASGYSFFRKMGDTQSGLSDSANADRPGKVKLSEEEWKKKLTPEEYKVARNHGTEPAWTGKLLDNKDTGVYMCTCCGAELFSSANKFDSGSGWPSFDNVLGDKDVSGMPAIETVQDRSAGMVRTEVRCGKCDAHLGHVFDDGPKTTGKRYCINSVCLKFKPEDSDKQEKQ